MQDLECICGYVGSLKELRLLSDVQWQCPECGRKHRWYDPADLMDDDEEEGDS